MSEPRGIPNCGNRLDIIVINSHECVVCCFVLLRLHFETKCHTLISSGDHCLVACNLRLIASRYLTPVVRQSVRFRNIPEVEGKYYCAIRIVSQHSEKKIGVIT